MAFGSPVDTLTRINLDDFFDSLGWTPGRHNRALLEGLMWLPARRFAEQVARYDALVAERGLPHGAEWILKRYLRELRVAGREHFPASGPVLVLANHPGMADTAALFVALGRPDLRIVALERPFLKTLANTSRQLIYVPNDPAQRMPVARAVVAQLRAGRAVLTFPAGEIEPDPAVMPGAVGSLARWSDSVSLFARLVPETQVVPVIVSGVLHAAPQQHPFLRLRRDQKDKEKLAAMLQILWRGYQAVTVRVAIGAPLPARELLSSGEPQRAVVEAARQLIEHPPTDWQTLVRGLR
jgi:1-acyl-sn-glycerol-3-phosphate acyltransferase